MKTKYTVVLAVLAGVIIGALAVKRLHAQAPSASKLPAFYIAEFEVSDPEGLKPYSARVASTLEPFGAASLSVPARSLRSKARHRRDSSLSRSRV